MEGVYEAKRDLFEFKHALFDLAEVQDVRYDVHERLTASFDDLI
jgi:hypothetical protein